MKRKQAADRKQKSGGMQTLATWFYLLIILIFTIAAYYPTISAMKPYIDDNDPYTYNVIVLPVFFIFLFVFYAGRLEVEKDLRKFWAAFILVCCALTLSFQQATPQWSAYRLDLLSIPFFVAGALVMFFGIESAKRVKFILAYLLLIWPLIFYPLYPLQQSLTDLTTDIAYYAVQLFGLQVQRLPVNVLAAAGNVPLEIATACVALGAFLGIFVLLLSFIDPLSGQPKNKLAWIAFGIFLVWFLNLARIIAVILLWYNSGLNNALSVFHTFSGNIIFDSSLVISLLSIGLFGLKFKE